MILLEEPIYILNFIDIYRFTPVSGCVGMGLSSLLCPGAYDAVKTALRIIIYIFYSGFVCTYSLACLINTELSSLKTNTHRLVRWYFHPCLLFWTWSLIWQHSISAHVVPFWCVFFVSSCCRLRPVCNVPCNIYSTVFRVKRLNKRTRGINDL